MISLSAIWRVDLRAVSVNSVIYNVINVQAIHSFDTKIYDHIVNIDQLVVTTLDVRLRFTTNHWPNRLLSKHSIDAARFYFACILL